MDFDALHSAIRDRFPNAQFSVSCFKTIDEIETKKLTDADVVIYQDAYQEEDIVKYDNFIIRKREDADGIYFKDIIDELIRIQFIRNDCDHRYMENIRIRSSARNKHSIPTCSSFWGS